MTVRSSARFCRRVSNHGDTERTEENPEGSSDFAFLRVLRVSVVTCHSSQGFRSIPRKIAHRDLVFQNPVFP